MEVLNDHRTVVVNLFGVPGAGKSTGAAYIFSKLKMLGYDAELVTEFAKDKVWEESVEVFKNQAYIFGKQYFRMTRCAEKVNLIITDSPLLLCRFYNRSETLGDTFNALVTKVFHSFENVNFLINRVKKYNPSGRFQNEEQSDALAAPMKELLRSSGVEYTEVDGCEDGYNEIVSTIVNYLS